ncbi:MAG TPA: riboflavin synthase [Ignavibacteria bacterium]
MFTGIVTDMGKVMSIIPYGDSIMFSVKPTKKNYLKKIITGHSIAINGACMTIEKTEEGKFNFTTIKESLSKTNLGNLTKGKFVNLEKPMLMSASLDGHIVQGHIDATGKVVKINKLENSWEYYIKFDSKFRDNIIYVGSISVNGISLTISDIIKETEKDITIKVSIIPHTYKVTNFQFLSVNDKVNLEFDMLGKYVKRILKRDLK